MKQRRSMLIVPGNDPARLLHAELYNADSIVFELERAIADEKDEARDLVKNALQYNEYSAEVGVHINPLDGPFGHDDLTAIVKACPAFIRLPNIREEEDLVQAEAFIANLERQYGHEAGRIRLVLSLDTTKGILNAY
ncbi:MAG: aldolase/citrate lyase family protein, partial [Citrobacter braakii]